MTVEQRLNQESMKHHGSRDEMQEALEVVLNVQILDLKKWEKPQYEFMQLLSLLPTFNTVEDL